MDSIVIGVCVLVALLFVYYLYVYNSESLKAGKFRKQRFTTTGWSNNDLRGTMIGL